MTCVISLKWDDIALHHDITRACHYTGSYSRRHLGRDRLNCLQNHFYVIDALLPIPAEVFHSSNSMAGRESTFFGRCLFYSAASSVVDDNQSGP